MWAVVATATLEAGRAERERAAKIPREWPIVFVAAQGRRPQGARADPVAFSPAHERPSGVPVQPAAFECSEAPGEGFGAKPAGGLVAYFASSVATNQSTRGTTVS